MTPKQIEAQLRNRAARALLERSEIEDGALAHLNPPRRRPRSSVAPLPSMPAPQVGSVDVAEELTRLAIDAAAAALEDALEEAHREAMSTPLGRRRDPLEELAAEFEAELDREHELLWRTLDG